MVGTFLRASFLTLLLYSSRLVLSHTSPERIRVSTFPQLTDTYHWDAVHSHEELEGLSLSGTVRVGVVEQVLDALSRLTHPRRHASAAMVRDRPHTAQGLTRRMAFMVMAGRQSSSSFRMLSAHDKNSHQDARQGHGRQQDSS